MPLVEQARVTYLAVPLEKPFISGVHKITQIRNVVVELGTDGQRGAGFSFAFRDEHARATYHLAVALARDVLGREATAVRATNRALADSMNFVGLAGPPAMALSCVDSASWDLHARLARAPLQALLGSCVSDWPVYGSGGSLALSTDQLVAEARTMLDEGFAGYKFRVGSEDLAVDVARMAAVRDAVGASATLMVDANQAWSRAEAARAVTALAEHDPMWIEEPLVATDVAGLALLRREQAVPIAAGETVYGVAGCRELLEQGAVDYLQPDLMRCGGLTSLLDVIALAKAEGVPVMPHLYTDVSAHVLGLLGPDALIEYLPGWFDHLTGPPDIRDGRLRPGRGPGCGGDVRLDELEEHVIERIEVTA